MINKYILVFVCIFIYIFKSMDAYLRPLVSWRVYDNHQAEKAFSAEWLSYKDSMKPMVADQYPCY